MTLKPLDPTELMLRSSAIVAAVGRHLPLIVKHSCLISHELRIVIGKLASVEFRFRIDQTKSVAFRSFTTIRWGSSWELSLRSAFSLLPAHLFLHVVLLSNLCKLNVSSQRVSKRLILFRPRNTSLTEMLTHTMGDLNFIELSLLDALRWEL